MAIIFVQCPKCKKEEVIKFGRNTAGNQRYKCKNKDCDKGTFLLAYSRKGDIPEIKQKIIDMALNGSGIRDTARVLGISMNTVMSELKKKNSASKQ
jgi:transposase-like protein